MSIPYFTVEEVERHIPKLQKHVGRMMELQDELTALSGVKVSAEQTDWETEIISVNINKRFHELSFKYFSELDAVIRIGGRVKDVTQGLVDFHSKLDGKDILLCWQYDDPALLYYHDLESGFAGRKPVSMIKEKLSEQLQRLR